MGYDGKLLGTIGMRDTVRENAKAMIQKLKAMGGFTDVIIAADQTKEGLDIPGTELSGKFLSLPTKFGNISAIGRGNDGDI